MRIAVIGGTGAAGRHTVEALDRAGHESVVISRARGVDVTTGVGLEEALAGVDAVVDVTSLQAADVEGTRALFAAATRNILAAEERARVRHHVLLSIVGIERIVGNAHYAGKRQQEEMLAASPIPVTLLRATQFHEFAEMVVAWTRQGDTATVPPALVQPVAASDVGEALAEIAAGKPLGRATDLAGPERQDLLDMARRTLAVRGESIRLIPSWGLYGIEAAGEVLLPGPEARLAPTTFDAWLARQAAPAPPVRGVQHVSVSIARPPGDVYEFASDPKNLRRWAAGLARSEVRREGDAWVADAPFGRIRLRFAPRNDLGVMDHDVTLETGVTIHNPMRVMPSGAGSELVFTLIRQPGTSDVELARDRSAVESDLQTLKDLLERTPSA